MRLKFANIICNPFNKDEGLLGYSESINITHNFSEIGTFIVPVEEKNEGYLFAKAYSLSIVFTVLHEQVVGWDDKNGKFRSESYPYKTISEDLIPSSAKIGSATSNLRGSLTQDPASVKGLTMVLGG